jgi:hypothetical protein
LNSTRNFVALLALCAALNASAADTTPASPWAELARMHELDQQSRTRIHELNVKGEGDGAEARALWDKQNVLDAANMKRLAELLAQHGWPTRDAGDASNTAFLIIQHADLEQQRRYLPMMQAAQKRGDLSAAELGMLEDRILMREGKPQRYGSQLTKGDDGKFRFHPIEDEAHVDERRAAIGMEPMSSYAAHFGLTYVLPKAQ